MIVDTSALVAVLKGEPEAAAFLAAMVDADTVRMSAGTYLETGIVVDRLGNPVLRRRLDDLFDAIGVRIEAVTLEQAKSARAAYRDFGKGSGRPAGLNFGDCFSYALAISTQESLLFKGDDFTQTDVTQATS